MYEFALVPSSNEMSSIETSIALALASKVTEAKFICVNLRSSAVGLSQCPPCLCGEIHFLPSVSLADEAKGGRWGEVCSVVKSG